MGYANYRAISPPSTKQPAEYTTAERRAQIFDLIEQAGHYRNLQRSYRELGDRFGVSHETIRKDINRVLEWKANHLGDHAEAELETLKTKAVREKLENGEAAEAYRIMSEHYDNLQSMGEKSEEPVEAEVTVDASERYADLVGAATAAGSIDDEGEGDADSDSSHE